MRLVSTAPGPSVRADRSARNSAVLATRPSAGRKHSRERTTPPHHSSVQRACPTPTALQTSASFRPSQSSQIYPFLKNCNLHCPLTLVNFIHESTNFFRKSRKVLPNTRAYGRCCWASCAGDYGVVWWWWWPAPRARRPSSHLARAGRASFFSRPSADDCRAASRLGVVCHGLMGPPSTGAAAGVRGEDEQKVGIIFRRLSAGCLPNPAMLVASFSNGSFGHAAS
jgi:hypothetical protein